jgi:hypothetical protein
VPEFTVANINPGLARTEMWNALLALREHDTQALLERLVDPDPEPDPFRLGHIWSKIAGPYLDAARNVMCEGFLDHCSSDYLVFVDSDVAPKVADFYRLVETAHRHQLGCLSGVYHSPQPQRGIGIGPVVFHWGNADEALAPWTLEEIDKLDPDVPHMVDVVGAGFLCLSRRLLEEMRGKYPAPSHWFVCQVVDGLFQGEDAGLCHRLADWSDDSRPHVLPGLVATHYKTLPLARA